MPVDPSAGKVRIAVLLSLLLGLPAAAQDHLALRDRTVSLIQTEELILDLSPRHAALVRWIEKSPRSPDAPLPADLASLTRGSFATGADFESVLSPLDLPSLKGIRKGHLPVHSAPQELETGANPFAPLLARIQDWRLSGLGILSGRLVEPGKLLLQTKLEASGTMRGGTPFGLKAQQELTWQLKGGSWQLTEWHQQDLTLLTAPVTLFQDVTATVVPDPKARQGVQRFTKRLIIEKALQTGSFPVPNQKVVPFIQADNAYNYPSIAIVDYDNDGWDDVFLTSDWDPSQMLRNRGDGTFEDTTAQVGLGLPFATNCAVFADFDNDGDQDAFIGGSLTHARYMENREGRFHEVTEEKSDLGALYFVSALSVSDVNRDGLLDVYASTYGPVPHMDPPWEKDMLPKKEWDLMRAKQAKEHRWLDLAGPSNVLLMNRGEGVLERQPYDELLSQWRRSFQGAFADFDQDGDDDLYICNDFAPDELLRNDTPAGARDPVFTRASELAFPEGLLGFGMGASWGDYDRDGDLDLYVSNMYSKAGKRIIAQMGEVDPRVTAAARGNFLFEWQKDHFVQRAGDGKGQAHVHRVGWSYGGQFGDLNNDGFPDLYVPSGYYTAPPALSTMVDN